MRTEISSVSELPEMHLLGHTCANLNGDLLFVWGGSNESLSLSKAQNSDLWIYETLTGYWRYKKCAGECPPYLTSSSSCLIGQKMYIFGGHSTLQDNWLNCLYCLDLDTFTWRDVGSQVRAEPTKPIRSDKNVCWSYSGKLYVFGGYGWSQVEHYSELLDCQKDLQLTPDSRWPRFGWNNQLVEYNPSDRTWRWPDYKGKCPSARAAHSGSLMGDKYFIFGGRDSQERLNDLYSLNMKTLEWQQVMVIAAPGTCPSTPMLSQRRQLPIGHLGDEGAQQSDGEDQMDTLDENHRQLVEEMHDVQVEEEDERWNRSTASETQTGEHSDISLRENSGTQDETNENFEYPHPSHLLERWSLSSTGNYQDNEEEDGRHNDPECLYDFHQELHQDASGVPTPQTSQQAQNLMPLGHAHLRNESREEQDDAATAAAGTAHRSLEDQLEQSVGRDPYLESNQQQRSRDQAVHNDQLPMIEGAPDDGDDVRADDTVSVQPSTPAGRSFCSLTPISRTQMLLFGGVDSDNRNLDDCWLFDIASSQWTQIDDFKHRQPRLWHTGARTKQNEVVILGGSSSRKIDEFCSDVLVMSFEAKSLKRLALDAVSRSVRMKSIQRTKGLPSTLIKLIKLRKQAMALTMRRSASQRSLPLVTI